MHQHPFEAPGRPKRSSRAGHKPVVSGLVVRSTMSIIGADRPVPAGGSNSYRRCRGQFQIPPPRPETPSHRAHPVTGLVRAGRPVPLWHSAQNAKPTPLDTHNWVIRGRELAALRDVRPSLHACSSSGSTAFNGDLSSDCGKYLAKSAAKAHGILARALQAWVGQQIPWAPAVTASRPRLASSWFD